MKYLYVFGPPVAFDIFCEFIHITYLLAAMPVDSQVKFCSPQNLSGAFKTSPHLLKLLRRMLPHCFVVLLFLWTIYN